MTPYELGIYWDSLEGGWYVVPVKLSGSSSELNAISGPFETRAEAESAIALARGEE